MSQWRSTTLGALCERSGGLIQTGPFGSQLHASDYVPAGVPVVMPQNIGENVIVAEGIARISEADAGRLSRHLVAEGDILYSRRGDVERRALVRAADVGSLCGTGCLLVRTRDEEVVDPPFLSYRLGAPDVREWIRNHAVGATMPNLNTGILSAAPITLPAVSEQRAIAEVLGALDDKIAVSERVSSTAEELAVSLVEGFEPAWPLASFVEVLRATVDPGKLADDQVDHYSLPAFDAGRRPERVAPETIKSSKFVVAEPSVLVSKLNPRFPRIWEIATRPAVRALASTEFVVLRPEVISTSLLWAMVSQPRFSSELESLVAGTSGSHQRVKPGQMLAVRVPDPLKIPVRTQLEIALLSDRARAARHERDALVTMRDALLPALMSGRLRVRDAETVVSDAV